MTRFNCYVFLGVFLVFCLIIQGCEPDDTRIDQVQKIVKIGVIAPLSGDDKNWGESGLLGVETAIDLARSEIGNIRFELIKKDDGNEPATAQNVFKELVVDHNVSAILMLSGSASTLGVAELADHYQTPIVSTLSTHPEATDNKWLSQIMFDDRVQGTVAALFVLDEMLIDRVGVVKNSQDPHSTFLANQFTEILREAGGEIKTIDIAVSDLESEVRQLSEEEFEFIYLSVSADEVVEFEQMTRTIGWHPQTMVSDGILAVILLDHTKDVLVVDGMLATDVYSVGIDLTDYGKKITDNFESLFDKPATSITALSCEGTSILLKAIQSCGDEPNKTCINLVLRGGREYEGIIGPILIDENGKAERPVFINRINNRKLEYLLKVN